MNKKTQAAYDAAISEIGEQGMKLSKADYYEYIDELIAHLHCIDDCRREEEQAEEDK